MFTQRSFRRRRRNYLFKQALLGDINIEIPKTVNSSQKQTHMATEGVYGS